MTNEWFARDTSKKVRAIKRAQGMAGKHTAVHPLYGYKKDPDDPEKWIIDDEAAEIVRRIFRMTINGKGPYEDHVAGKLTDKRFLKLSQQYEAEQEQLESELKRLTAEMETMQEQTGRGDKFMALVDRYTSFDELTTPMLNEFVEKVVVHERVSVGRYKRKQRVDVYFNFIGLVELPAEPEDEAPATVEPPQERYVAVNTSFAPLGEYLSQQAEDSVTLSFADVERVIGKPLCKSAFKF